MPGQTKISWTKWLNLLALVIGASLLCLNILRMLRAPITYDEVDMEPFKMHSYTDILFHFHGIANNHILNTLAEKLFTDLFGERLFTLRMGSLVAMVMFFIFCWLLCKKLFTTPAWQFCALLMLLLQPFVFEFWALARGYALAISFMTGAVYFLVSYIQNRKIVPLSLRLL